MKNEKTGIICVNLGSPDSYHPNDIKKFLKNFLSDVRVIRLPKVFWWPILNCIILKIRPKKLSPLYKKIWREDGSPLVAIGNKQATKLQKTLTDQLGKQFVVKFACCYSSPNIESVYTEFIKQNIDKIIILPLYPQYSSFTTGIVYNRFDKCVHPCQGGCAFKCKNKLMCNQYQNYNLPKISSIFEYYKNSLYIDKIASSIEKHWQKNGKLEHLVFSFHGIPLKSESSNLYVRQCYETSLLVAKKLNITNSYTVAFQSRFGFAKWIEPYTTDVLSNLAKNGIKKINIVCPGFAADCLETLEEVAIGLKNEFLSQGGEKFEYIPALNASKEGIQLLAGIIAEYI
jgi:ferrochelatase